MVDVGDAVDAIAAGEVIVYPTETVYGLGADVRSRDAVERVFELKRRPRSKPLSVAVGDAVAAREVATISARADAVMRRFLPGPVTVVCEKHPDLPAVVTGGKDRVGIRVPDHDLARKLLRETGPLTATSANVSGGRNVREPAALPERIRAGVGAIVDGGRTPGGESTVVDPDRGQLIRPGLLAEEVAGWLDEQA